MTDKITAPEMPGRLKTGPLTIMVPDKGDPCGTRRIARPVGSAHERGVRGAWVIGFADDSTPLVTSGTYGYEVTTDAPGVSGPCDACKADAAHRERRQAAEQDAAAVIERALREHQEAAREEGRRDGEHEAAEEDINGTPIPEPTVPAHFADVAGYYTSGHDDGIRQYRDDAASE